MFRASRLRLSLLFLFAVCASQSILGHSSERAPKSFCTNQALAALIAVPKLEYECGENEEASLNSFERRVAIGDYLEELRTTFARNGWWKISADELNACLITNEARVLTKDEQDELIYKRDVFGDSQTRLVTTIDPCVHYSYDTIDGFVLQRAGSKLQASQVLNAYYSRIDGSVDFYLASHAGERLAIVETATSDGMMPPMPFTTFNAFVIDPVTHRAVPRMLFIDVNGLTNAFQYDDYVFDDERLYKQWKAPILVQKGVLAHSFEVMTLKGKHYDRQTYAWNGRYFDAVGPAALGPKLLERNKSRSLKALVDDFAAAYANRDLGRLDATWRLSPAATVSIQLEMNDEIEGRQSFTSFEQMERWLRRHEDDQGLPFRETRKLDCSRGTCVDDLDGGILHNQRYLKRIKYRYVGRRLYITSVLLLDG